MRRPSTLGAGHIGARWLVSALAVAAVWTAGASADPTQTDRKTWIWRGTVTMDAKFEKSEGYEHGFTYRFRSIYLGRWIPGFNRSQWKGNLTWEFEGYSYREPGGPGINYCAYKGSGSFHTCAGIFVAGGEGERRKLVVGIDPHDYPRDGPTVNKLVRTCEDGSVEELGGREAFKYTPVIQSFSVSFPTSTRSFSRTTHTLMRWEWAELNWIRQPVRIVFKRTQ